MLFYAEKHAKCQVLQGFSLVIMTNSEEHCFYARIFIFAADFP